MFQNFSPEEKAYFLDFLLSTILFLVLIWNIFLHRSLSQIKKKQKIFFQGKKGTDLEETILSQKNELEKQKKALSALSFAHAQTKNLALSSLHQFGLIRFNPFRDIGGDQSFSLALLNGQKDGLVISSLYSREGVRVYSKAIQNGEGVKYPLTDEEKSAINLAIKKKK